MEANIVFSVGSSLYLTRECSVIAAVEYCWRKYFSCHCLGSIVRSPLCFQAFWISRAANRHCFERHIISLTRLHVDWRSDQPVVTMVLWVVFTLEDATLWVAPVPSAIVIISIDNGVKLTALLCCEVIEERYFQCVTIYLSVGSSQCTLLRWVDSLYGIRVRWELTLGDCLAELGCCLTWRDLFRLAAYVAEDVISKLTEVSIVHTSCWSLPCYGGKTSIIKSQCQTVYDVRGIVSCVNRYFRAWSFTCFIVENDDEVNHTFINCYVSWYLLARLGSTLCHFWTVGIDNVINVTCQCTTIEFLGWNIEFHLTRECSCGEFCAQTVCCSRCSAGCRNGWEAQCHECKRCWITTNRGHVSRLEVDRIELELTVFICRCPVELIGTGVELTTLMIVTTIIIGDLHTCWALQSLSTSLAINLIKVAFLADTVCETIIGNTQCYVRMLRSSNGCTGQVGVINHTPLEVIEVRSIEFAEYFTRLWVVSSLKSEECKVAYIRWFLRYLPVCNVESEVLKKNDTEWRHTGIKEHTVEFVADESTTTVEESLWVVCQLRKIDRLYRMEREHTTEVFWYNVSPHDSLRVNRYQVLRHLLADVHHWSEERRWAFLGQCLS